MFIMLFVLSIPLNENDYVIYCIGKSWLKSCRELDAHFIFIAFNKHEPLVRNELGLFSTSRSLHFSVVSGLQDNHVIANPRNL